VWQKQIFSIKFSSGRFLTFKLFFLFSQKFCSTFTQFQFYNFHHLLSMTNLGFFFEETLQVEVSRNKGWALIHAKININGNIVMVWIFKRKLFDIFLRGGRNAIHHYGISSLLRREKWTFCLFFKSMTDGKKSGQESDWASEIHRLSWNGDRKVKFLQTRMFRMVESRQWEIKTRKI